METTKTKKHLLTFNFQDMIVNEYKQSPSRHIIW